MLITDVLVVIQNCFDILQVSFLYLKPYHACAKVLLNRKFMVLHQRVMVIKKYETFVTLLLGVYNLYLLRNIDNLPALSKNHAKICQPD